MPFVSFYFKLLFNVICGLLLTAQLQHLPGPGSSPISDKHSLCSWVFGAKGKAALNSLSTSLKMEDYGGIEPLRDLKSKYQKKPYSEMYLLRPYFKRNKDFSVP